MKRITDPTFKYTPSHESDIRKTFDRIRRENAKAKRDAKAVTPIRKAKDAA